MSSNEINEILKVFMERHISLRKEWLSAVLKFLQTNGVCFKARLYHLPFQRPIAQKNSIIFYQWLYSDIRESSIGLFEIPKVVFFSKSCVFQVGLK
jgi:hypothetical protein